MQTHGDANTKCQLCDALRSAGTPTQKLFFCVKVGGDANTTYKQTVHSHNIDMRAKFIDFRTIFIDSLAYFIDLPADFIDLPPKSIDLLRNFIDTR